MSTRRVRGETGAIFEVDAAMIDVPPEGTYRTSSAPPHASAIRPADPVWRWSDENVLRIVLGMLAVSVAIVVFYR